LHGRALQRALSSEVRFEVREKARFLARRVGAGRVVVVSTSMVQRERALETLGSVLLIGGPLILIIASSAGYLVAAGALRPVERMRRRAADISAATPGARLPLPPTRDEVQRLGATLNAMLGRLEAGARQERSFLAGASHELRTPLAILKAEVDLALHPEADAQELRAAFESVGEEVERLARLAEDLLVVARGQEGRLPLSPEPVDLAEMVDDVIARFRSVSGGGVRSSVERGIVVRADRMRLEQALGNLVDNALRHGSPPVTILAEYNGRAVELHILDDGPGFAPGRLGQAFERTGRSGAGGFGLGLPIVASIVQAHGGEVSAANGASGADVRMTLPLDV
jgi:signal transduction histidine kinase